MSGHTYTHTHDNYYNPRCAHAHQGLMMRMMTGSGAYDFPPPSNHPSLGQSNSSGQSSHSSTFAFGSSNMYDYSSDCANQQ